MSLSGITYARVGPDSGVWIGQRWLAIGEVQFSMRASVSAARARPSRRMVEDDIEGMRGRTYISLVVLISNSTVQWSKSCMSPSHVLFTPLTVLPLSHWDSWAPPPMCAHSQLLILRHLETIIGTVRERYILEFSPASMQRRLFLMVPSLKSSCFVSAMGHSSQLTEMSPGVRFSGS